jgi:hypothetical protein
MNMPLSRASTVDAMIEVSSELGRLQRMEVGFVDAEQALKTKGSGWLLDRIETFRIDNSMRRIPKPVIFPCQRWIGESESGSRSGGPLQTLFPLAMELSYPRLGMCVCVCVCVCVWCLCVSLFPLAMELSYPRLG